MEHTQAIAAEDPLFLQTFMEYLRQKVDTLVVRFQQLLGRAPSTKTQYMPTNHEQFNKKHVRSISVVVYLLFVCMFALCAGVYYYRFWKPCAKKILFRLAENDTCAIQNYQWKELFWPTAKNKSHFFAMNDDEE